MCYCETPLDHERTTVYDEHFEDFKIEVIDGYESYAGQPFMDYLSEVAARDDT